METTAAGWPVDTRVDGWSEPTVHGGRGARTAARRTPQGVARRPRRGRTVLVALLVSALVVSAVVTWLQTRPGAPPSVGCHLTHCTGQPGATGAPITRRQVAARAGHWLDDTHIRYSMTDGQVGPGGWGWFRRDCSGFVSMALHLSDDDGGPSTVGLARSVRLVRAAQLRPYDLIGRLGAGSGGENGHVQFFLGWADASHTRVRVAEQGGLRDAPRWPHETTYPWPERMADGTALRAYRYVGIRG